VISDEPFPGLQRRTGRPRAAARLTQAEVVRIGVENEIFTGVLAPGEPVDEETLSRRFGVSRTPVREAIFQLVDAGLLVKNFRQGASVAKLDLRKLVHMFETISELEGLGARLAARRMTPAERKALEETHRLSEAAMLAGNEDEYAALGRRFHAEILAGSHNEVLADITRKLAAQIVPYRRFQLRRQGRVGDNQADHDAIIAAIVSGDDEQAYLLMKRHGAVQGDVLADYISLTERYD
jgi:DNA-binding GntR family transcriptional regulator